MKLPVFQLTACTADQIPLHTPVIGPYQFEYYTWIHTPPCYSQHLELFQLDEISPDLNTIEYEGNVTAECNHPWIKVVSSILNQSVGYHLYKLSFVDIHTGDVVALYFAYIVQDGNVDKPYVYMDRSN